MPQSTLEIAHQTMLESLPVAIIIVDAKGLVHFHNREADTLFTPYFLDSTSLTQWSDKFNEQDLQNAINKLKNSPQAVEFTLRFSHAKKTRSFQLKLSANPDQDDLYLISLHLIGDERFFTSKPLVGKEPSEYKKNFKELKQFSRLSAMREISSSFADKLNQPLTAILSYTQAMQRLYKSNASSEEITEAMERVVVNAQNAGKIIKDIRAQLNVNTLNSQSVCINQLIQESVHLTELDSIESPIRFTTHYEPTYATLWVDRVQMRQVIFSLLNNAIDAVMEHSNQSPQISLTTVTTESHYEIVISDNGPGFPEEVKNKLFEPFTTTKENGIGIGLSMCHHIIKLHQGDISIVSDNNPSKEPLDEQRSTVVTICLPLSSDKVKPCH